MRPSLAEGIRRKSTTTAPGSAWHPRTSLPAVDVQAETGAEWWFSVTQFSCDWCDGNAPTPQRV